MPVGKKSKKEPEEEKANVEESAQADGIFSEEGALGGFSMGTIGLGALALGGLAAAAGGGGGGGAASVAPSDPSDPSDPSSEAGYRLSTETAVVTIPDISSYTMIAEHSYDASGHETKMDIGFDIDGNGVLDELEISDSFEYVYQYDAEGHIIVKEEYRENGTVSEIITYEYDSDGNCVAENIDLGGDGVDDMIYTYEYDSEGNCIIEKFDFGNDGTIEEVMTYTYNSDGSMASESIFFKGVEIEFSSYVYDDDMLTINIDGGHDGTIDDVIVCQYDSNGNCLTKNEDWDNDGTIDVAYVYDYTQGVVPVDYEPNFVL